MQASLENEVFIWRQSISSQSINNDSDKDDDDGDSVVNDCKKRKEKTIRNEMKLKQPNIVREQGDKKNWAK